MTANGERRTANSTGARCFPFAVRRSLFALVLAVPLSAQAPVRYVESVSTDVRSRTAVAEQVRVLGREAQYAVTRRGDTTVVQVLALELQERDAEATTQFNTDGFVGGRWKLVPDSTGVLRVIERPFLPPALLEVSDLTTAMDDFFPPMPVRLAVGEKGRDAVGRAWQRLADSASVRRYHWEIAHQRDTTAVVRDSLLLDVAEDVRESSELRLDARGAPVAWLRQIVTEVSSRGAGRAVRATIRHRIAVRLESSP